MKIANSTLQMESQHSEQQSYEVSSSMRSWTKQRTATAAEQTPSQNAAASLVQLSDSGRAMQSNEASAIQKSVDDVETDPKLRMIRSLVSMLTGKEIRSLSPSAQHLQASASASLSFSQATLQMTRQSTQITQQSTGPGAEYTRHESYSESEQTSFAASGVINTADGKQISFAVSLSMSRSYREESSVSIQFGSARQTQDPLVLNFDGNAADLTDQRFTFDLNSDGNNEEINFVAGGSGFLALDRNGDGLINDGSELFGTKSGDGFADLATLDDDHNGWIDENDAAYAQLRVWTKDSNGSDQLSTLKEADVGAIALAHAATSFDIKDASNELQGRIKSSGIFLHEDGGVGTIQQVDLTI